MEVITAGIGAMLSDPMCFVVLLFGVLMGIIFGCIPGLTATLGVALMIPITYTMTAHQGLTLLIAIYVGGISGGLITATLINIPGTPSSIFTCYDGYPMTKAGKPGEALTIGVFASLIGGTASALALILIAPQLAKVVLAFGSWEYFAVCILGLAVVITMSCEDVVKGLIGALLGLLLGCVGIDAVSGVSRLDFGNWQLQGGIQSTALMMGLFAIREILHQSVDLKEPRMHISMQKTSFLPHLKEMKGCAKPIALGCLIGTGIGILPGIGQNAATMITYNQSKSVSKHPERFGHGSPEGICASETSNNAVNGGALIPLVTMGIPGDLTTSALLGGLTIHGLQAGPLLFTQNHDIIGTIMVAYALANFVMYIMELGLLKLFIRAIDVKFSFLFPAILMFCVMGVLALNNRMFDVWMMMLFGVVAYVLEQLGVDMTPIILGFILGPMIEKYFRSAMIASSGMFLDVFTRPISCVFMIVAVTFLLLPLFKMLRCRQKARKG